MLVEPFVATFRGSDALFYPLVLCHVVCALAGFGSIGLAGTYASRAAQMAEAPAPQGARAQGARLAKGLQDDPGASSEEGLDPESEELVRYFAKPARFWKAVLAVPVFGVLALASEPGGKSLDQVWDLSALLVWACAALLASSIVVPSLRQMSTVLLGPGANWQEVPSERARLGRYGRLASRGAAACDVLFLVALALMIWRP